MKKWIGVVLLAIAALALPAPARAQDSDTGLEKVTFSGEVRTRYEYQEHMNDPDKTNENDTWDLFPYRVQLGVTGHFANNVKAHIGLNAFGLFGGDDPSKGVGPSPNTQYFPSAFYGTGNATEVEYLYEGYLEMTKIGGTNIGFRAGRAEHTYSTELMLGDADFYSGVSFDGIRGWWGTERMALDIFYYRLTQRNFIQTSTLQAIDGNLFGATFDFKISDPIGTVGIYTIVNQRPEPFSQATNNSSLMTYGAHFTKLPSADSAFDWNAEIAAQSGDINGTALTPAGSYGGFVGEGWFGWSFGQNLRSRVHAGVLMASGDDTPTDNDNDTFQSIYSDLHAWNRLGDTDVFALANIMDINAGYALAFGGGKHSLGLDVHIMEMVEEIAPGAETDLGTEVDVRYDYQLNKNMAFQVGLADLMSGDGLSALAVGPPPAEADDIVRFWAQARLTW